MIEIEKDGVTYHAGISHSEKDHMIPLTKDDLEEGASFDPGDQAFAGLSNKSQVKLKFGELGNTKADFDERLLDAHPKLKSKVDQRSKS